MFGFSPFFEYASIGGAYSSRAKILLAAFLAALASGANATTLPRCMAERIMHPNTLLIGTKHCNNFENNNYNNNSNNDNNNNNIDDDDDCNNNHK